MQPNINPYGPNPEPTPEPPKKDTWRTALSTIGILIAAFFVAFLIMFFVFRSYQVEGPSMEPTLSNGDRLIIWKFPRTWARVTARGGRLEISFKTDEQLAELIALLEKQTS